MKKLTIIFVLTISILLTPSVTLAHSGCCSNHDGVRADGCGCNDGTPLSNTCAPYYTCNASQKNTAPANNTSTDTYVPPMYVSPTIIPTNGVRKSNLKITPTQKPIKKAQIKKRVKKKLSKPKPTPTPTPQKSWWQHLFGM